MAKGAEPTLQRILSRCPALTSAPMRTRSAIHEGMLLRTIAYLTIGCPKLPCHSHSSCQRLRQELAGEIQEAAVQELLAELEEANPVERPDADAFDPALISNLDLIEP